MTTGKLKIIKNNYCQIGKSGLFLHKMQKYARHHKDVLLTYHLRGTIFR